MVVIRDRRQKQFATRYIQCCVVSFTYSERPKHNCFRFCIFLYLFLFSHLSFFPLIALKRETRNLVMVPFSFLYGSHVHLSSITWLHDTINAVCRYCFHCNANAVNIGLSVILTLRSKTFFFLSL